MKLTWKPIGVLTVLGAMALAGTVQSVPAVAAAHAPAKLDGPAFDVAGDARLRPESISEVNGQVRLSYGGVATDLPAVFELNHDGRWRIPTTVIKEVPAGGSDLIVDPSETGILMLSLGGKNLLVYTAASHASTSRQRNS
jgi:hypothetical protein